MPLKVGHKECTQRLEVPVDDFAHRGGDFGQRLALRVRSRDRAFELKSFKRHLTVGFHRLHIPFGGLANSKGDPRLGQCAVGGIVVGCPELDRAPGAFAIETRSAQSLADGFIKTKFQFEF